VTEAVDIAQQADQANGNGHKNGSKEEGHEPDLFLMR